jgi:hypothetical protein
MTPRRSWRTVANLAGSLAVIAALSQLSGSLGSAGAAVRDSALGPSPPALLTVSPANGSVGSVVTVRLGNSCGTDVVFSPAGATNAGTDIGNSSVQRYVIPSFTGVPAVPVRPGSFQFGVTCGTDSSGAPTNTIVPFAVTSGSRQDPFVGMAKTSDGGGYWLARSSGNVISFGDAAAGKALPQLGIAPAAPITGMAATPDGGGLWLVGADGGVFALGDASYFGSLPGLGVRPIDPIIGIAATETGHGYWLLGADGGVFGFGDAPYCVAVNPAATAPFHQPGTIYAPGLWVGIAANPGSTGYIRVGASSFGWITPRRGGQCGGGGLAGQSEFGVGGNLIGAISTIGVAPNGDVWEVGSDGGVFTPVTFDSASAPFGGQTAPYFGSLPGLGIVPNAPIVAMAVTPDGDGYWLLGADGGVFSFGDASYHGSAA